jgi:hypothetical protein
MSSWLYATFIPFPIQMDLWYECIETVCLYWFTPLIASSSLQAKLIFAMVFRNPTIGDAGLGAASCPHRPKPRRTPCRRPSRRGAVPFRRATSAVSSSPPCSTDLWITAVRHDLRTKVPHRHSGVHGTPLERRQRQWRWVDGISLMCRFEFCDLLGDHLP